MDSKTIDLIRSNDHLTLSRVISEIESNSDISNEFFNEIYSLSHNSIRIGVTGPPGAGKSTLTNQIIKYFLTDNKSVGIIAIDPTSPFTGGALLGDRVRMNQYLFNDNVFIRSMGSRGDLGGLTKKAQEVGDVLAASGKDIIIYETVGVGQGELDVSKAVDVTIVVLVPESGDEVQLMKAGLIEIADIFVINKSDRDGSGRLAQNLASILHSFSKKEDLVPEVYSTSANKGDGVEKFYLGLNELLKLMQNKNMLNEKKLLRHKNRILQLVQERLLSNFWSKKKVDQLKLAINNINSIKVSHYEVMRKLFEDKNV
ncbi:MAG: methylmalonyl Co-A mutase-associated GTPase MeaB [Candidatus Marinimicrobia bacterium]|nr:methylmalonyl Co-A mutase-associated GTPase MeaB [Candidatus Neomarinimicrobiota bacterium]MBT7524828.1 methylmalonyl Co-A mutase-associated GTPase MeaB [Candidatus Neomarinimicrobiota bacterium]